MDGWIWVGGLGIGTILCVLGGLKSPDAHMMMVVWSVCELLYFLYLKLGPQRGEKYRGVIFFHANPENENEGIVGPTFIVVGLTIFMGLVMFVRFMFETGRIFN